MTPAYEAVRLPESTEAIVAGIAATQFGVFSRRQALESGVNGNTIDRRVQAGLWLRLHPGIYRLAGSPVSWRQGLLAACFAGGPQAVASHAAAARLWTFPGFEASAVELTLPRGRKGVAGARIHRTRALLAVDVTTVDRIPVTTPARTLLDLAGHVARDLVEEAFDDALRRKLVTISRMRWRLKELRASGRAGVPQSRLETRMARLLRHARLPQPVLQHEIKVRGRLIAVLDFAYPERRIAIETDGYRWHSSRRHWEHDRVRLNALQVEGWTVLRFTWERLKEQPDSVAHEIRSALLGPGLKGTMR